jgi:hypothetical protein
MRRTGFFTLSPSFYFAFAPFYEMIGYTICRQQEVPTRRPSCPAKEEAAK